MSELARLPELLRRKDVLRLCRIGKDTYYDLITTHKELVTKLPGHKEARVKKSVLLALILP